MEEKQEFENFYNPDYSFNVEVPKGMKDDYYRDYTFRLNNGITPDERLKYYKKNIPYAEGLLIAGRKREVKDNLWAEGGKAVANGLLYAATGFVRGANTLGRNTAAKLVIDDNFKEDYYKTHKQPRTPQEKIAYEKAREEWYKRYSNAVRDVVTPDEDTLSGAIENTIKNAEFELKPQKRWSLGWWLQNAGNVGAPLLFGLAGGIIPEMATSYGFGNYADTNKKILEGGGSLLEADRIAALSGSLETALEYATISKYVTKLGMPRLQRYGRRFLVGSGQEVGQSAKDMALLGKYDTRSNEEKEEEIMAALIFGGLGEALGLALRDIQTRGTQKDIIRSAKKEGMSDTLAKDVALTATVDETPDYERLQEAYREEGGQVAKARLEKIKGDAYDMLVELGNDPEMAAVKVSAAVGDLETQKSQVIEDLKKGTYLTQEEKDKLLADFEEAVNEGGEDAGKLLELREMITDLAKEKGLPEDEYVSTAKINSLVGLRTWKIYNENSGMTWEEFLGDTQIADVIIREAIGENPVLGLEQYGIANPTDAQMERAAIMEENGASEEEIRAELQAMGENGKLFSYIGEKAKNTPKGSLKAAKEYSEAGLLSPEDIRKTTGWFKGLDGKWRLEISDKDARIKVENIKAYIAKSKGLVLSDILDHPILFGAYPNLQGVRVLYRPDLLKGATAAAVNLNTGDDAVIIGSDFARLSSAEKRKTLMHEVQHLIQAQEGFATGGSTSKFRSPKLTNELKRRFNERLHLARELLEIMGEESNFSSARVVEILPQLENKATEDDLLAEKINRFKELNEQFIDYDKNTAYAKYRRLAGEIEAHDVEARIDMSDKERRETRPDIDRTDAIVLFDDGSTKAYVPEGQKVEKLFSAKIVDGVVDITDDVEEISKLSPELREIEVENKIDSLIGELIDTATEPLQIQLTEDNKWHVINSNIKLNPKNKKLHQVALKVLDKVINNAYKTNESDVDLSHNTNPKTIAHKKNVDKYVYFESPVKIGTKNFVVYLASEQVKNQNPTILDLYNVRVKRNSPNAHLSTSSGNNVNIAQENENVKLFSRVGYASMRNPLEGNALSTSHYGEGESGHTTHGYGNYVLFDQKLNEKNYFNRWSNITKEYYYNGEPLHGTLSAIANGDETKESVLADLNKEIEGYNKEIENQRKELETVKKQEREKEITVLGQKLTGKRKLDYTSYAMHTAQRRIETAEEYKKEAEEKRKEIEDFDESKVEKVVYYPNMKYKGKKVKKYDDNFGNFLWYVAGTAATQEELDQEIKEHKEAFRDRVESQEEIAKSYEKKLSPELIERAKKKVKKAKVYGDLIERGETAKDAFGEQDDYLLYKTALFELRANRKKLEEMESYGKIDINDIERYADAQQWSADVPDVEYMLQEGEPYRKQSQYVKDALERLNRDMEFPKQKERTFTDTKEAEAFYLKQEERYKAEADGFERFSPKIIDNEDGSITIKYTEDFRIGNILDETREMYGEAIYDRLTSILGSNKAASEKLLEYGIKGIDYWGYVDGHGAVVFEDVPVIERLLSRNQGAYTPVSRIIELAREHTPDTFMHEVNHNFFINYFDAIERVADKNSDYVKEAKAVYDLVGKKSYTEFTNDDWEFIVQSAVKYMHTGEAPSLATKSVFDRAKNWTISIYNDIVKNNPVSPEMKEFFDSLISEEQDLTGINELHDRIGDVLRVLNGAKTGKEAAISGKDKQDIDLLLRALNARRPRAGKTLAQEIRQDGGIDIDSELAKTLGYDPKKKNPIFKKGGRFEKIDEIEDYLRDKGVYNFPDAETAEQVAKKEEDIIDIIQNADMTFSQEERYQEDLREAAAQNQAAAQKVLGEIMEREGLKNLNEVEDLLLKARKQMDTRGKDIIAVNKNAIKYIESSMYQAKRELGRIMKEQNNARYNYQQKLKDVIRGLPISYKNKDKLMGNIARVSNKETFDKVAPQVIETAKKYAEMEEKNMYRDMIKTFLSGTYQKGIKNKRFTYEGNKLFEKLRNTNALTKEKAKEVLLVDELHDINELTKEKAEEALLDRIQKTTEEVLTPSELIIRRLLQYKALGADMSLDNIRELALDLGGMIDADIKSRQQFDEIKGLITKKNVEDLVNKLDTLSKSSKAVLMLSIKNGDFYSMMNEIGGKEFADKFNMRVPFAEQELYLQKRLNSAIKQGAEIYGVTPNQFIDVVQELSEKKYTITPNDNYGEDQISKMEIMHILLGMRQKDTKDLILHAYEKFDENGVQLTDQIGDLIANLDVKDIQFASMLQREIAKDYDEENKAYIFRNGVDMPHLENYFPRKSRSGEHGEEEIDAYTNLALQVPSFYKMRGKNSIPIFENVWTTFKVHKADASYAIKVFPKYLELYKVMHNTDVQHRIGTKYGKDVLKEVNDMIKSMGAKAYTSIYSSMNGLVAKAAGNWIKAKIGINPAIFAKQLISVTNYAENMPIGEYLGNMGYAATHPKEAYNFMQEIAGDFINTRFKLGRQNEVLSRQMATTDDTKKGILKTSTAQSIDDVITFTVRAGDIAPIIYGGYARVKYLMEKEGKTKEEAREMFIDETLRSQQASSAPTTSNFQKQGGVTKLLTAFQNTPFQYARILAEAQTMHRRGEISDRQYYKTLLNYMIVQPFLLALATNGFYNLFHDDDKDKDLVSLSDVGLGAATSWLGGVPLISNVAQSAVQVATGEQPYGISIGLIEDINKAFQKARKKEKTNWDYIDVITPFVEIGTGKPLGVLKRYTKKIVD